MKNLIYKSKTVTMKELNNLFIEMTEKSCNQRCNHCYINFPLSKKTEDFININTIKTALNDTTKENIKCIYLTGAEPMTHPDFNIILRLCLKRSDVCICTNGSFINEKKARFLKKVQEESNNEIIFQISIDNYDELKNDAIRYRGAFRHGIFAIKQLTKYNFTPIIKITNFYDEPKDLIINNFLNIFEKLNCKLDKTHLHIIPYHDKNNNSSQEIENTNFKTDCMYGRVLSAKGIYSCPFLSSDYRGRCGSSFKDYNQKSNLETDYCTTCTKYGSEIFAINYNNFS